MKTNNTQTFVSLPAEAGTGLQGLTDANALHVLLKNPLLPNYYIVFDGEQYWQFGTQPGAWATRRPYKGQTDFLRPEQPYHALLLALPFKIRPISEQVKYWYQYNGRSVRAK
ncbi:hypothetical protein [Conchiformibius steedae]|uniref:hypothetical protein n=1 Tax=Conchiformibius steedae TaxID=153493 RepID=UPI0026F00113|nr:hypothetical protein [Conchiformibius steedae]